MKTDRQKEEMQAYVTMFVVGCVALACIIATITALVNG